MFTPVHRSILGVVITASVFVGMADAVAQAQTVVPTLTSQQGVWISRSEVLARPMSGAAWTGLLSAANKSCGTPNLSNQDDPANVCVMAKALVFVRTGTASYRTSVVTALRTIVSMGRTTGGRSRSVASWLRT